MSRVSALSASTSAPAVGNGHFILPNVSEKQAMLSNRSKSISVTKSLAVDDSQGAMVNPDELFAKQTISEVKFVQQRLRADADAKQEELRLMVGERYRDLLQASTSIIAIASSSQRVKQALEETKGVILSQEEPPLPQRPALSNGNDSHLHTLQLLSAHLKLLLDAPEHLWRLIERKKYFPAAWLFLLARVVHRALVRDEEQEEERWSSQGVDVLEEFPLVQRQWEAVSQFRSQIIHKATLSLREHSASVEDTCATLLTLHLLDSRPLTDTLSVFLAQRSKTLISVLSWKYESDSPNGQTKQTNGYAQDKQQPSSEFRRRAANQIKDATHSALNAIAWTVNTSRSVFQEEDESQPSLIRRVLESIQTDSPNPPETTHTLPAELYLTTQTLLNTLPSSTHFLLLPLNLRSYKPYVDLNSSSSTLQHSHFTQKMNEWFQKSSSSLQKAVTKWFADLQNVKEVWSIRSSTKRWLSASKLDEVEVVQLAGVLDELCRHRVIEIWKLKLSRSLESFGERLDSAFSSLNDGSKSRQKEASPVDFLFQAPALPTLSQGGLVSADASFQKYKASLRRQLVGRTSLLHDVLATLENCARTIRQDLAHVMANSEATRELVDQLEKAYRPDADALCADVVDKIEQTVNIPTEGSQSTIGSLVFLGRVSDELSSSSPFISDIGCTSSVVEGFREKTTALHGRVIDRWRAHNVRRLVREHRLAYRPIHHALQASLKPSGPSSYLVQSLLAFSNSLLELGVSRNQSKQQSLLQATLQQFVNELTGDGWDESSLQSLHDLAFLWKLASVQGDRWSELPSTLEKRLKDNLPADLTLEDLQRSASESLARTQTLFATLLPQISPTSDSTEKFLALLPFGIPQLDQQFQPALELAKPTSRFGLLLAG
ncbi:hypothetical protein DXG03_008505 [Asterophora parasitica]|uniref:Conserved oligomeric Golgi complex subunit 1 n=1 Tax=Asterophora parasitica TaxID=117018 RepID=A0A9P7GIP9_9AGAR|nr:hypothetical protein DXG03_008505 [Asterophora parasitica]